MHIIHPINDFLFELFPKAKEAGNSIDVLKQEIETFYTVGPFKPAITIVHGIIDITIEGELIEKHNSRYQEVIALCEERRYNEAKERIAQLIREAPHISEYHRLLGQIISEQGDWDDALNSLIDALRWDPRNERALIMTGNILARYQYDLEAAMKYYERAVQHKPDDYVSLTLIAINLIQHGSPDAARQYLDRAFAVNPAYPNIYYAFGLLAEVEHNFREAFEMMVVALFKNPEKDLLYQQSLKAAIKAASEIIDEEVGGDMVNACAAALEEECGKKIVIEADAELKCGAKIEFAENDDRTYHLVTYNPEYPAVHHLIMHELTHLLFATQARKAGTNRRFLGSLEHDGVKLSTMGYHDAAIRQCYSDLLEGLEEQLFNTPIDLYIEDYLFRNYPDLMPYQFLSLAARVQEGTNATTDKEIVSVAPPAILSKSKIFNLVSALHLLKRYGVNLIEEHKSTIAEREQAEEFYRQYEECRTRHTPGDEYGLLQSWAEQLSLQSSFSLVEESGFGEHGDLLGCLCAEAKVELPPNADAVNLAGKKMPLFTEPQQGKDINMAVTRFMVEALSYFRNLSDMEINDIAIQISLLCGEGITPDAEGYTIPLMADKTFTGYQMLAYSYVSWAKAFPDSLKQLQLPFDKEYAFAQEMVGMVGR